MNGSTTLSARAVGRVAVPLLLACAVMVFAIPVAAATASSFAIGRPVNAAVTLARPHVLTTRVADVLVRVRGDSARSGTPITGTTYIVTAAHCVLDDDGAVVATKVERDRIQYVATSVLVDQSYVHDPSARLDAAVLIMDEVIPGPSAALASAFPTDGVATLVGFQPIDTDGSLLRGTRYDNRPLPTGASGGVVHIEMAAAGCVHHVSDLKITAAGVKAPCGLIPGVSGGGLFVEDDGELILAGVISNVTTDLTDNGVVPLAAVRQLLDSASDYAVVVPAPAASHAHVGVAVS